MRTVVKASPLEEFTEKLPDVYLADEQEEILLEPGDLLISTGAGWQEVMDALVLHAKEYMPEAEWDTLAVLDELNGCT